jgi:hypothetical protein
MLLQTLSTPDPDTGFCASAVPEDFLALVPLGRWLLSFRLAQVR